MWSPVLAADKTLKLDLFKQEFNSDTEHTNTLVNTECKCNE